MSKRKRKLLERSFAWIRLHPFATNLDVPEEFVAQWIFEDDEEDPKPAGYFMSVFAFGHMQRQVLGAKVPLTREQPLSIPASLLFVRFGLWQMKLGLAQVNRMTNLQIDPLPLFEFPDDEEIRYQLKREDIGPTPGVAASES